MIRENIEYEAKDFAYKNYTYDLVDVSIKSFIAGAKWADKHPDISSLWHNTSEEPKESVDILFMSKNGKVHKVSKVDNSLYSWLKDNNDLNKWAYINDILPQKE